MATNGTMSQEFAPVLAAMATMRDGQREQKIAAHEFLEKFQKSVREREIHHSPLERLTNFVDGSMEDYDWNSTVPSRGRSQTICSYNT